jgi:hypothetical protein
MLIHVGYVKTGSTWLQWNVLDNAELGLSAIAAKKDIIKHLVLPYPLWYDPEEPRKKFETGLERCAQEGLVPVLSHERLSGNPVSGCWDNLIIAERLADLFPDARILLVFREQRTHILSIYQEYVVGGGACSLQDFVIPPVRRSQPAKIPGFDLRCLEFDRIVSEYRRLFGPERVLAMPYELFATEPTRFVNRIFSLLQVPVVEQLPDEVVRRGVKAGTVALLRRSNFLFGKGTSHPSAPFSSPAVAQAVRAMGRMLPGALHRLTRRRWETWVAHQVSGRFAEGNRRLAEMTGFDLAKYDYQT